MNFPLLDRLGPPGIIALGLLLFCLSFYLGHIEPAQVELAALEQEAASLRRGTGEAGSPAPAPRPLPSLSDAPEWLRVLNGLAGQHGMSIDRASFILSAQEGQLRLETVLPLKASYPSLRAFLRDTQAMTPPPVVDELVFQRQQSGDALIDAQVRLSSYFSASP